MGPTGSDTLRGVNLGGWLVLEPWITPSLFVRTPAKDEYSFMQEPGAAERIEKHRKEFIREADFRWLAKYGVNAVRIPVGYWLFEDDTPFTATVAYLDWAMDMAEKYELRVLIDLHAAKGSQNGYDHSGRIGRADWFSHRAYREETTTLLARIAARYRDHPSLWGIELLNEPKVRLWHFFTLRQFYRDAYGAVAAVALPKTRIVFSDAFMPRLMTGVLSEAGEHTPVLDAHWYQFGRTKLDGYFERLAKKPLEIERLQRRQPVIVGEWSGMLSHETLAGIAEKEQGRLERQHIEQQLDAYARADGWFYWTYKTEGAGIWNFRRQVETGNLLLR